MVKVKFCKLGTCVRFIQRAPISSIRPMAGRPIEGECLATLDHKIPLSKGGSNWPDNLQMLCFRCNMEKNDKDYNQWLGEINAIQVKITGTSNGGGCT